MSAAPPRKFICEGYIEAETIEALQGFFTELDFRVGLSTVYSNSQLQGGRYCSIKGVTAAQLRFASESDGKVSTLYQVPYEKALFGSVPAIESDDSPMVLASKGLNVQLWVEKGLLMVLVEENSDFSKYILKNHKN